MISGDNRYVTAHLAEAVGLNSKAMLTGDDLGKLKDEALWHRAPRTDLFVEIDPQQKERIVRALQKTGHSVGYLGDGINDAPALHAADVGISVEEAVDVARESADIILLRRDLDVLRTGVEDGRRTFANTLKYISITTSANFGNMVSMALATPLLPFLPLAAKQILLNNFLSDIPSITISSDNVDPDRVSQPQRWNIKDIQLFMVVFGLISSVFDLATFAVLLLVFHADQPTFQTFWFVVSLLTELAVVLVLRTHQTRFSQHAQSLAAVGHDCGHRRHARDPVSRTSELGVWICASLGAPDGHRHCHRHWLHCSDGRGEGLVLWAQVKADPAIAAHMSDTRRLGAGSVCLNSFFGSISEASAAMMGDVALIVSTSGVGRAPLPTARQPRIPYTRAVRLIQVNDDSWSGSQSYKKTAPWPALSRWGALVLEERPSACPGLSAPHRRLSLAGAAPRCSGAASHASAEISREDDPSALGHPARGDQAPCRHRRRDTEHQGGSV